MNIECALHFIRMAGVSLVRDVENNIIGIALGGKSDGPVVEVAPNEFSVVAHVARFEPSEQRATERARASCVEAGRRVQVDIQPDDVKVVEVGDVFSALTYEGSEHGRPALVNTQKWFKALRPGIGIANAEGYPNELRAGTIGFFVEQNSQHFLVSCNHVLARANRGHIGEAIVQPATLDLSGGDLSDQSQVEIRRRFLVGELSGWVPITPDNSNPLRTNVVDVALAQLAPGKRDNAFGRLPYSGCFFGSADPYQFDSTGAIAGSTYVYKVGRTTGYTEGYVSELAGTTQVQYGGWTATFVNQIVVTRTVDNTGSIFSEKGDSGSALLTDQHRIAGLIFAGGPRRTLANPID
jgi:hypothetical protein